MTDPTDTAAVLLAGWHGFGTAEGASGLLAQDSPDDAVLARNAEPVFAAVTAAWWGAPSLPYTDRCIEAVDGLTPPDSAACDPDLAAAPTPAMAVRRGILAVALELNTLLPEAAGHARDAADRAACQHGTRLAYDSPD